MKEIRKIIRKIIAESVIRGYATRILPAKLTELLGVEVKFFNAGSSGYAYTAGPDKIVKITSDHIEAENALKLIGKNPKYLVNYYRAEPFNDAEMVIPNIKENWFLLLMDKLENLSDRQHDIIDLINNSLGLSTYILDANKRMKFLQDIKNNPEWIENIPATFDEIKNYTYAIKRIYEEGAKFGISLHDVKSVNIGINSSGNLVHFDIGKG